MVLETSHGLENFQTLQAPVKLNLVIAVMISQFIFIPENRAAFLTLRNCDILQDFRSVLGN